MDKPNVNLYKKLTTKQRTILHEINIDIEDKEYPIEEIRKYAVNVEDTMMSYSHKNGDIARAIEKYGDIINIMDRCYK